MESKKVSNAFDALLRNQRGGGFLNAVSGALMEAVEAVKQQRKPAKVCITLVLKPANADVTAMSITDEIKTTLPKPDKENSLFFTTDENLLVTENPRQRKLEFAISKSKEEEPETPAKSATA